MTLTGSRGSLRAFLVDLNEGLLHGLRYKQRFIGVQYLRETRILATEDSLDSELQQNI